MPLNTLFTKLTGVQHPIMQGGMHFVGYAELAAAVSNAGGLGTITALTQKTPESLRQEIQKCKKLTKKPFAVNITLLPALQPPDYPAYTQVVIDEGVKIVETAGRNPGEIIKKLKENGILVIHKCVSVRHALTAQRIGVDIISMDGFECGGHPGEEDVTNWILYAKAAKILKVPFICSGGSADERHLAAALAFGGQGINMGTRFMATQECQIHENIKQALVKADERNTTLIMRSLNNTERVYKNDTTKIIQNIEKEKPGDIKAILNYVKGENYRKSFQETGDVQSSAWSCGQSIGLIDDIPTCQQLVERIVKKTEEILLENAKNVIQNSKL